jgi:hypothetical protein
MKWSKDIENILENIRNNSVVMSNYHKRRFYVFKSMLKYFRIPTILFSAIASVVSVGLQPFVHQSYISIATCLINLMVGIINSIELFLTISATAESELSNSKDFYLLAVSIFKMLQLKEENRGIDGMEFLNEKYGHYCKLIESSDLINDNIVDKLAPLVIDDVPISIFSPFRRPTKTPSKDSNESNETIISFGE